MLSEVLHLKITDKLQTAGSRGSENTKQEKCKTQMKTTRHITSNWSKPKQQRENWIRCQKEVLYLEGRTKGLSQISQHKQCKELKQTQHLKHA